MLNKLTAAIIGIAISLGASVAVAQPTGAVDLFNACSGNSDTAVCKARNKDQASNIVQSVISLLLWIIGAVSVIMIVIGGFKYVTSNGDSNKIQSAKNTIMYAVIGVVVALVGQGVILFVIDRLT